MTLITLEPFHENSNQESSNDTSTAATASTENSNKKFQLPIDDLDMPLADLYDIIFSLTDIPPPMLVLYHNGNVIERPPTVRTLRQIGISVPTTIKFTQKRGDRDADYTDDNQQPQTNECDDIINLSNLNLHKQGPGPSGDNDTMQDEREQSSRNNHKNTGSVDKVKANQSFKLLLQRSLYPQNNTNIVDFHRRLQVYQLQVKEFEDPEVQMKVLQIVPVEKLKEQAKSNLSENDNDEQVSLLKEVLKWFKQDFFTWVNNPPCYRCVAPKNTKTKIVQTERASPQEFKNGKASKCEIFMCELCNCTIRFARYEDAFYLIQHSRKGRCGEWAKVFTLVCQSLGYTSRMVHDWTDHVWTEVFLNGKWFHCDSCEQSFNEPLLYESGWGKKLTYCIATSNEYIMDVTKRYTKDISALQRDKSMEIELGWNIMKLNIETWKHLNSAQLAQTNLQWRSDVYSLNYPSDKEDVENEGPQGRQSGSKEWVQARGEDGSSSSSR